MDITFNELLNNLAKEIVANKDTLTEKQVMFLLQKYFNPYPKKSEDYFSTKFMDGFNKF